MERAVEHGLHREWESFKEIYSRRPTQQEWIQFVHLRDLRIPKSTLHEALNFEIEETMDDDIEIKVRDAQTNLNNRSYVDGSF